MKFIFRMLSLSLFFLVPQHSHASFFEGACPAPAINASGTTFEAAFTPADSLSALEIRAIQSAKKEIRVASHRFVSKDVSIALVQAAHSGKDVKIVLDRKLNDNTGYSAAIFFINMSLPPHMAQHLDNQYQEYIIIDDKDLVVGNISSIQESDDEKKNSANVLLIHDAMDLVKRYQENWQRLWDDSVEMKNENLIQIKKGK